MNTGVVAELTLAKSGSSPLSSISMSRGQTHGVVGGRELMKVIKLTPDGLSEIATLKSARRTAPNGVVVASNRLSMYDVSWCHTGGRVAASLSNGGVDVWHLQHLAKDTLGKGDEVGKVVGKHERSVNRLCWDPHDRSRLLSGSQDGLLKIWDTRDSKPQALVFKPKNGSVRDVQFSPLREFKFAAVFDNGRMQIWDYRYHDQAYMKILAHAKTTVSVEWHHSKPWRLATGSHDKTVRIWDLNEETATKRDKMPGHRGKQTTMEQTLSPSLTISSPAAVSRAKWRPEHENQIAMSQDPAMRGKDVAIHLQDVTSPTVPLVIVQGGNDQKNGFCWLDTPIVRPAPATVSNRVSSSTGNEEDGEMDGLGVWQHIISCSELGTVRVHSLAKSRQPRQQIAPAVHGISSRGELAVSAHEIDHDPLGWKIYHDSRTQGAPGIFREVASVRVRGSARDRRRRSPSAQRVTALSQARGTQAQRFGRSHSVGDRAIANNTRRAPGPAPSAPPIIPASNAQVKGLLGSGMGMMLPKSPAQTQRGRASTGVPMPLLKLAEERGTPPQAPEPTRANPRSTLTYFPVNDPPVALDKINWKNIVPASSVPPPTVRGPSVVLSGMHRGLGPHVTEFLTMSYSLRGYHVRDMCAHNMQVCLDIGYRDMAYMWRMLGVMLAGVPGGILTPLDEADPDFALDPAVWGEQGVRGNAEGGVGGGVRGGAGGGDGDADGSAAGDARILLPEALELMDKYIAQEGQSDDDEGRSPAAPGAKTPSSTRRVPSHLSPPPSTMVGVPSIRKASGEGLLGRPRKGAGTLGKGGPNQRSKIASTASTSHLKPKLSEPSLGFGSGKGGAVGGVGGGSRQTGFPNTANFSEHGASVMASGNGNGTGGLIGGNNGGTIAGGSSNTVSLWNSFASHAQPSRAASETVDGSEAGDNESAAELAWNEWDDRLRLGGSGGGSVTAPMVTSAGKRARANGTGKAGAQEPEAAVRKDDATERLERLPDENTLGWLWPDEVRDWLEDLCEVGEYYHVVAICEVVRNWYYSTGPGRDTEPEKEASEMDAVTDIRDAKGFWLCTNIPKIDVRKWYIGCIEQLRHLQLICAATEIIKNTDDLYIKQIHRKSTSINLGCNTCGSAYTSGTRCTKCARRVTMCSLCERPTRGQYRECPGCHHGGHSYHLSEWFKDQTECPFSGCTHQCMPMALRHATDEPCES